MKKSKIIMSALLVLALVVSAFLGPESLAASKNRAAGKAFANALSEGQIKYGSSATYSIGDMDGDGVKDLLVVTKKSAKVYVYKSGKVKRILRYIPEYSMGYDTDKKVFWETGEGDGGWAIAHTLKDGKLVEKYRYYSELGSGTTARYYYRKAGKDAKSITKKKYTKVRSRAFSFQKEAKKKELIEILNALK